MFLKYFCFCPKIVKLTKVPRPHSPPLIALSNFWMDGSCKSCFRNQWLLLRDHSLRMISLLQIQPAQIVTFTWRSQIHHISPGSYSTGPVLNCIPDWTLQKLCKMLARIVKWIQSNFRILLFYYFIICENFEFLFFPPLLPLHFDWLTSSMLSY